MKRKGVENFFLDIEEKAHFKGKCVAKFVLYIIKNLVVSTITPRRYSVIIINSSAEISPHVLPL